MWCRSIRSTLAVVGSALLAASSLASSAACAQQRDDAWVIAQVMAGKFEELRSLEKLSASVPFAMYWWGSLMQLCVFHPCDEQEALELILRAAKGGHGRAQAFAFTLAATYPGEFTAKMTAGVGAPTDGYPRQVHAIQSVAGLSSGLDPKVRADFVALATSERQVGLLAQLVKLEGLSKSEDELRAVADSGYVEVSYMVRQLEIIRRTSDAQMIERARAGELWLAAAHCDIAATERAATETHDPTLQPDTLSVCERAAAQGFPGAVRGLPRHHHHTKNQRAAEYFAGVCDALLGLDCAEEIFAYYHDRRDESADLRAKWELWYLAGSGEVLRDKDEGLRRSLFMLYIRTDLIYEACMTQRLDVKTGAREANPECPWRRPIAIPAEFLSGAR